MIKPAPEIFEELVLVLGINEDQVSVRNGLTKILDTMDDLGYRILSTQSDSISATAMDDFKRTLVSWSAKEIEMDDTNAEQVLHSLMSSGWIIVPPS